ncbi:S8 family serine peptidase [Bacillus sp. ISL-47]|uniref:S8 family peptidase n=1 Tax=Bacillus sp. ISL-47 TaxID=2819130 RepID=UPI001BE961F3|nr:S8 family serine peptidase [Bacillus sp. ISL-47]MBT2689206.1 S8 family serine peptidase [Bacillus sp. ISL-47]MBT2708673.1 S8 family serine peptidase [Pseudomonas sp. ISL-84]
MKRIIYVSLFLLLLIVPFQVEGEELTERVIITFEGEVDEALLKEHTTEIHHIFDELSAASVTIPSQKKEELLEKQNVLRLDPDSVVKTSSQISDWGYVKVNAPLSKKWGWTGEGIKVGVIDTGIRTNHPDLKVAGGVSFVEGSDSYSDDMGHGTHVAGIIGAQDNSIGVVGVAPEADIYAIKALDSKGEGNISDIIAAIDWAMERKMDIINLSVTSPQGSYLLSQTLQKAYNQDIIIVAASGNSLTPLTGSQDVLFPARYPTVIGVGSINRNNQKSSFAYYGESLELVAPGEKILSTYSGYIDGVYKDYTYADGTSMASPFVAGIAALYKQAYPEFTNAQIRTLMQQSAVDLGIKGKDNSYGYGLVQPPFEVKGEAFVSSFPDIKNSAWYAKEIEFLYENDIITGYPDGSFVPQNPVTRAEAVTMIGKAMDLPGELSKTVFSDVPENNFASGYIKSATDAKLVGGFPDDTFKPKSPITRADVAVILKRAYGYQADYSKLFTDVMSEKYYFESVHSILTAGITNGYPDGTFKPAESISRAEFAVFLARALDESYRIIEEK